MTKFSFIFVMKSIFSFHLFVKHFWTLTLFCISLCVNKNVSVMIYLFPLSLEFPLLNQFVQQLEEKPVTLPDNRPLNSFPTREQLIGRGSLRFDDLSSGGVGVAASSLAADGGTAFQVRVRSDSGQVAPGQQ